MPDFKNSETAKNLMRAFAGESQAKNRYTFAAGLARAQKMPVVEAVFLYTANQEKEHAEIFYKYLEPLDKETICVDGGYPVDLEQNTLAQLKAAAHNEYEEHDVVYKAFGDKAEEEGFPQIAASFRMIAQIEKTHGERFQYLADLLEEGRLFRFEKKTVGSAPTADIFTRERKLRRNARCAATTRAILPAKSCRRGCLGIKRGFTTPRECVKMSL